MCKFYTYSLLSFEELFSFLCNFYTFEDYLDSFFTIFKDSNTLFIDFSINNE
jgi:hypothetical protein